MNDDQVDALSLIGRMLDKMSKGIEPKQAEPMRAIYVADPNAPPATRIHMNVTLDDLWREQERR